MSKRLELTGKRFDRLTVDGFSHVEKGYTYWVCRCDCGNEVVVRGGHLTSGATTSCGCIKNLEKPKPQHDKTGGVFGYLRALRFDGWHTFPNGERKAMYLCLCLNCGGLTRVQGGHLTSGHTTSCGCVMREAAAEVGKKTVKAAQDARRLPYGQAHLRGRYRALKQNAESRNIEMLLPYRVFKKVVQQKCHYCGRPPKKPQHEGTCNGYLPTSSIERYDSHGPYHKDNIVAACDRCNGKKGQMHGDDFKELLRKENEISENCELN